MKVMAEKLTHKRMDSMRPAGAFEHSFKDTLRLVESNGFLMTGGNFACVLALSFIGVQ